MRKFSRFRVRIRPPTEADAHAFLSAVRRSRSLHRPWVSPPATAKAFSQYLERVRSDFNKGFLVIHHLTGDIVGVINLNHVIRGAFHNAFLGYYAFLPHAGKGLMFEGMELAITQAFSKLKLHRLEANVQPENLASIALIKKCGFTREGLSRRYLKVCGRWKDHQRWAIVSESF